MQIANGGLNPKNGPLETECLLEKRITPWHVVYTEFIYLNWQCCSFQAFQVVYIICKFVIAIIEPQNCPADYLYNS